MIRSARWAPVYGFAAGLALAGTAAPAEPGAAASLTCTNPASGSTWQIRIDYANSTVDSHPAQISKSEISWRDPKDGANYTLDRASGELTEIVASSTGGYFLHHRCATKTD